jgi:hypothetical protein
MFRILLDFILLPTLVYALLLIYRTRVYYLFYSFLKVCVHSIFQQLTQSTKPQFKSVF